MKPMKAACPMTTRRPGSQSMHARAVLAVLCVTLLAFALGAARASADPATVTISLSLTKYTTVEAIGAGKVVGVHPAVVFVRVGDRIVFANDDSDHHTATSLLGATSFVADPRWTDDALHQTGSIGPTFWSTGDLAPGARSAPLIAQKAGTYLYGCFFDYGAGVRGEIVVAP